MGKYVFERYFDGDGKKNTILAPYDGAELFQGN